VVTAADMSARPRRASSATDDRVLGLGRAKLIEGHPLGQSRVPRDAIEGVPRLRGEHRAERSVRIAQIHEVRDRGGEAFCWKTVDQVVQRIAGEEGPGRPATWSD